MALFLLLAAGGNLKAQDSPVWDKQSLRDSIISLLSDYQVLHNQINGQTDPRVERDFIHLFSNPKVKVINNIDGQSKPIKISIEDYVIKVAEFFPEGLAVLLDMDKLAIDQPVYDRNNRYIINVRINRSLDGMTRGKVFSSTSRIILQIGFFYTNNTPGNFAIYGMDLAAKSQSYINAAFAPAITGFVNSSVNADDRLRLNRGRGYSGTVFFSYYFADHWGTSAGLQFSFYSGSIGFNKFDALGDFDPNLRDISIENSLWFFEVPLCFSYRTNPLKRLELKADLGLSVGIRVFEKVVSSAVSANTGANLVDVFTDTDWIDQMNRINLGLQGTIAMSYRLNDRLGIQAGIGLRQGLSGLDSNTRADFANTRYQGQYNPLWGAPGKTSYQAIFINIGTSMRLNREL